MKGNFNGDDDGPVDEGDRHVSFQSVLPESGVDNEVGASHQVDDADKEHKRCVF